MTDESATVSQTSSPLRGANAPHYERFLDCIHCGLCLPFCPTYAELGVEMDSPRGRLYLMRAYTDGRIEMTENYVKHLYLCLDCRACETACPSGVRYGHIVELARAEIERHHPRPDRVRRLRDLVFKRVLPSARLLAFAFWPLRLYQGLGLQTLIRQSGLLQSLPAGLREMEAMLPRLPRRSLKRALKPVIPAKGTRRYRVGLVTGCIMNEMFTQINVATARVLAENGCEVVIPAAQTCCGALHVHNGERAMAEALARKNIEVFEQAGVDAIIINSAGCGAHLKEYGDLLEHDPASHERAAAFSAKVKDISEFLAEIPLNELMGPINARVAYHDACHLAHGQRVREQPRALLRRIPGVTLVDLAESDWCCGSAGIYNITQPEMSMRLLARKMSHITAADPDIVATGNPGCLLQIRYGAMRDKKRIEVVHPVELLDRAYQAAKKGV
ncbi:MAG: 4Fe-4S dicluster domain-containing protein [Candidatus Latescibacteria bacterium]|nr:4Fe-4S dicluster domain-containing protein [Candidatus Latescibacterota bacterium]